MKKFVQNNNYFWFPTNDSMSYFIDKNYCIRLYKEKIGFYDRGYECGYGTALEFYHYKAFCEFEFLYEEDS